MEVLHIWAHRGQEAETWEMRERVRAFNAVHAAGGLRAEIEFFPDFQYTEKLSIAAAGNDLPDVFDLDGPTVAQFAEAGLLARLTPWFSESELEDFAPAILRQGTYQDQLVALGAFDSALVLFADRAQLEAAGVELPDPQGWSWEAFLEACRRLKEQGILPLTLHLEITADEWYTYAFSPLIWSGGGRLISSDGRRTEGVLNSPQNVHTLRKFQQLLEEGFALRAPVDPNPFAKGEAAMDWTGHWMAPGHLEAKGTQLVAMPLPRMGDEVVAASGSWCWAVSSGTPRPQAAKKWMQWILGVETGVIPLVRANGAIPSRASAYPQLPELAREPYLTFRNLQENAARARPRTPVYADLTRAFAAAVRDIANGARVEERLDAAAADVQRRLDRRWGVRK